MRQVYRWQLALVVTLLAMQVGNYALGQADEADETDAPAQGQQDSAEPTADETMKQLMEQRAAPPLIKPRRAVQAKSTPNYAGAPATSAGFDPAMLGIAPGESQPMLRREGEFIVNRLGRIKRNPDEGQTLFVFEADDKDSPESPMILQKCQYLETMENIVQERGSQVVFRISGQIHTYRGANYLLPTMMKLEVDQGNIRN